MKPRTVLLVLGILIIATPVVGSGIDIDVQQQAAADILVLEKEINADRPSRWLLEASNPGSVPSTAQIRLDVRQDNRTIDRLWSDRFVLDPGDTRSRELAFFQPSLNGTVTAQPVLHYGTQTVQAEPDRFTVTSQETKQGFNISKARLYPDRLHLGIEVPEDVETLHVTARSRSTRRFEQEVMGRQGEKAFVDLDYSPPIKTPREIHLAISGNTGRYYYTTTIEPEPLQGIKAAFFRLLDSLLE